MRPAAPSSIATARRSRSAFPPIPVSVDPRQISDIKVATEMLGNILHLDQHASFINASGEPVKTAKASCG